MNTADTTTDGEGLLCRDEGPVRLLTLNRTRSRNAIDLETATRLAACLDEFDASDELRVAILMAEGEIFSAGMDLKKFAQGSEPWIPGRGFAGLTQRRPRKPLIAAVEGPALGGGFEMVLACDMVIAETGTWFSLPEITRGIAPGGGGMLWLARRLPHALAMELVLGHGRVAAERAREMGLVNEVVEVGAARDRAKALATDLAALPPTAVQVVKHFMLASQGWPEQEAFEMQRTMLNRLLATDDAREGATAFVEKREPVWSAPQAGDLEEWFPTRRTHDG